MEYPVVIATHEGAAGVESRPIAEKVIDHGDHKDRIWLSKHVYWAVRNKKAVVIRAATQEEAGNA